MPRRNNTPRHQPLVFKSSCDKRRFKTEREALAAADYQILIKPELELSVYKCQYCGGWHLTRQARK